MTLENIWFCWECQFICPRLASLPAFPPDKHPIEGGYCDAPLLKARYIGKDTVELLEEPTPNEFARKSK